MVFVYTGVAQNDTVLLATVLAIEFELILLLVMLDRYIISLAIQFHQQKQKRFKLVEFPSTVLFKPNKHYVAELEKKDYLGKAKVTLYLITLLIHYYSFV